MKLSGAKCRIVGVQLGEAEINLIRGDRPPLRVKMALLSEDGATCGYLDIIPSSEKILDAVRQFAEVVETEVLPRIFEIDPGSEGSVSEVTRASQVDEPPQF